MKFLRPLCVSALIFLLPGCGHGHNLVGVTVLPAVTSITGPGVQVHYKAIGSYIHPPEDVDITNSVVWTSSSPQVVSIDSTGVATSEPGFCGSGIVITASAYSDPQNPTHGTVVAGTATMSVTQTGCP
jgi:hypothetical protein